jgi:ABC-2 type transport system permease protein
MYISVFTKNLKQQLMYRSEFFLRIIGAMLFIYIQISIWRALLSSESSAGSPTSLPEMLSYIIVAYLLQQVSRSNFTYAYADKVREGNIAVDLIRPINLRNYMFAEQLSENFCVAIFSCLPVAVISFVIWGFFPPPTALHVLLFSLSAVFALLLSFYFDYIAGVCVFWTKNPVYTYQIVRGLFTICSGTAIPLWFYPDWLSAICRVLPFRMASFEPLQIYLGRVNAMGAVQIIFMQIAWLVILFIVERLIWFKIQKNIFVQGG